MASMLPSLSERFDTASLKGNYAICCVPEGAMTESALIGVLTFDGHGRVSGTTMTNLPGPRFGERMQLEASIEGTYAVDEDGSGFGSLTAGSTAADGVREDITAVLLISKAEVVGGVKIAQEASIMVDAVDPRTGGLGIILASRHPDEGEFSLASFSGTYGGPGWGRGGRPGVGDRDRRGPFRRQRQLYGGRCPESAGRDVLGKTEALAGYAERPIYPRQGRTGNGQP